ncbi:MAG: MFS transporter [Chloroflexi bacterium]|nr:MFS transporter [Chloroflexota bacterium]
MAAYGGLSVVLVLYLTAIGLDGFRVGVVLAATLLGDALISLPLTTRADRLGRRRTLLVGAGLMLLAGVVFAVTTDFWVIVISATIGVLSPSGNEVGPFLAVEQASLSHVVGDERRTTAFGWYTVAGALATATGTLVAGVGVQSLLGSGVGTVDAYRMVIVAYAVSGLALAAVFLLLTPAIEVPAPTTAARLGLHRSRGVVARLSALFALDAFAGGFVIQSLVSYWFATRWGLEPAVLGGVLFVANVLAAGSALAATWLAHRIGLVQTMVYTHLPSNVLLMLVPLMPTAPLAVAVWFLRMSISQMDVPTRQSYTMAVVAPDERSAAAGITGIARTVGVGVSPFLAAPLAASVAYASVPFFIAGSLKIVYDLLVYRGFRHVRPQEERATTG